MTTLEHQAAEYFSKLNPLAKKIAADQKKVSQDYGADWETLSFEQKEEALDNFFFDASLVEKYDSYPKPDEVPESFPKLKIISGEKIIIDFENEDGCLTWRDEHSGPFSWETRSEHEIDIFDDTPPKDTGEEKEKKSFRKLKKSFSPDRDEDVPLAFKPEKSIWESPFLAADRGSNSDMSELLQNFALHKFSMEDGSDELNESQTSGGEGTSLLANHHSDREHSPVPSPIITDHTRKHRLSEESDEVFPEKTADVEYENWVPETKEDTYDTAESDFSVKMNSDFRDEEFGHVSPVFIEESGESSSDYYTLRSEPSPTLPIAETVQKITPSGSTKSKKGKKKEIPLKDKSMFAQINPAFEDDLDFEPRIRLQPIGNTVAFLGRGWSDCESEPEVQERKEKRQEESKEEIKEEIKDEKQESVPQEIVLPESVPQESVPQESVLEESDVGKTGFDFLDNW